MLVPTHLAVAEQLPGRGPAGVSPVGPLRRASEAVPGKQLGARELEDVWLCAPAVRVGSRRESEKWKAGERGRGWMRVCGLGREAILPSTPNRRLFDGKGRGEGESGEGRWGMESRVEGTKCLC